MKRTAGVVSIRILGLLAAGLLAGNAVAATPGKIDLSEREKTTLAADCTGGLDSVNARTLRSGRMLASVRCKPHARDGELPVARVTQCEKKSGAWKCPAVRDALLMTLFDDSVLALVVEGVPTPEAVQTINTLASSSVPPFHNGAIEVLQDQCMFRQLPERLFKGATHFTVDCTPGTLAITRDCWEGRCRFFITNATRKD